MTWFRLLSVPISIQLRILGTFLILVKRLFRQSKKGGGGPAQSAKSDLDQLVNCTLNALDSFCWKVEVFVLKNYFLLSLMFLLNFSIPFVQKQFHIGFHNGWKCRLGITIDVTYRMNSIQKRGGVELLLVCWLFSNRIQLWLSVNFIQGQYKAFFSICSTKPFTKQTTNQRSIFLLFWTFKRPLLIYAVLYMNELWKYS